MNVIALAANDASLTAAMVKSGWQIPDSFGFQSIARLASTFLHRRIYQAAPITPSFWNGEPNQLGFVKSAVNRTSAMRIEARFWRTRLSTPDGRSLYIGLVSRTEGYKWLAVPEISPDIDTARDELRLDLQMANQIILYSCEAFVKPVAREKREKETYFTDGVIDIIRVL